MIPCLQYGDSLEPAGGFLELVKRKELHCRRLHVARHGLGQQADQPDLLVRDIDDLQQIVRTQGQVEPMKMPSGSYSAMSCRMREGECLISRSPDSVYL
jgi:hypothetical protein